jgi:glycine/D-amino acid oxidase-like deaminating enzyme
VIKRDFIIVGQGIAGSFLAWYIQKANQTVIVIDDAKPNASSRVAAGIIHPVTGRRIVKTWMADALIPFAWKFYSEIENHLRIKIFHPLGIVELLSSAKEFNDWMARSEEQGLESYIDSSFDGNAYNRYLQAFHKKILIKNSAWVDTSILLDTFRKFFTEGGNFLNEKFEVEKLQLSEGGVVYKDIVASKIIFCDGIEAINNPYWKHLPFIPSKGEMIKIRADMKLDHILNKKIFILPAGEDLFKVGSTYAWKYESDSPSDEAREELIMQLKSVLKIPFEVVGQSSGIRPTVKDRRPMLGLHKQFPQVGIFNGLGTKGCLLAPYFANHMTSFLTGKIELMKEVDVRLL